jgi:hypothetical protein
MTAQGASLLEARTATRLAPMPPLRPRDVTADNFTSGGINRQPHPLLVSNAGHKRLVSRENAHLSGFSAVQAQLRPVPTSISEIQFYSLILSSLGLPKMELYKSLTGILYNFRSNYPIKFVQSLEP